MKVGPAKMLEDRDEGQQGFPAQKGRVGAHRIGTDLGDLQKREHEGRMSLRAYFSKKRAIETSGKNCSPTKNRLRRVYWVSSCDLHCK